jgi:NADPH2:quinone reductase
MVGVGVYEGGFAGLRQYLARGRAGAGSGTRAARRSSPTRSRSSVTGGAGGAASGAGRRPPPGPGEVRIRHAAIGINYVDVYIRRGWMPLAAPGDVLGVEASGVVLDVGPDVTNVIPGDRVAYALLPCGSYCGVRTVPAAQVPASRTASTTRRPLPCS